MNACSSTARLLRARTIDAAARGDAELTLDDIQLLTIHDIPDSVVELIFHYAMRPLIRRLGYEGRSTTRLPNDLVWMLRDLSHVNRRFHRIVFGGTLWHGPYLAAMFRVNKGPDEVLLSMVKKLDISRVNFTDTCFYLPINKIPGYRERELCIFFNLVGSHIQKLDLTHSNDIYWEKFNMPSNLGNVEKVLQRCLSVSEIKLSVSAKEMFPSNLTDLMKAMPVEWLYLELSMKDSRLMLFDSIADCFPNIVFLKVNLDLVVCNADAMSTVSLMPFARMRSLSILHFDNYGEDVLQLVDLGALWRHPSLKEIHLPYWVLDQDISKATVADSPLNSGINVIIFNIFSRQTKIYNLPKEEEGA